MRKILCMVFILLICFVTTFTYAENEENTILSDYDNKINEIVGGAVREESSIKEKFYGRIMILLLNLLHKQ